MRGTMIAAALAGLVAAAPVAGAGLPAPAPADSVVFAGGCFWGVQAVFEHVRGVLRATAGYAGGPASAATYEQVGTGQTGHAESVLVVFDPDVVTFDDLLTVFFSVAHDPTQLNRQGPDVGSEYRSAIWWTSTDQARAARAHVERLEDARVYRHRIVTEMRPLRGFYPAEEYHQDYFFRHPRSLYIVINDVPKVERLEAELPALWRDDPVRWQAANDRR